jgi:hypothetical protein
MMMVTAATDLSPEDADRFRSFERQRHDQLAATYHDFFTRRSPSSRFWERYGFVLIPTFLM